LAHTSFHDTAADVLARTALDTVIGDFKQEIIKGSGSGPPFVPTSNANMVPQRNNTEPTMPNLIRRSLRSEASFWPDPVAGPAIGSRASAVSSAPSPSATPNRGEITRARWNKHYLLPKLNTGDDGTEPIAAFTAPDWVFVIGSGPFPTPAPGSVIGRYAYAVYDEGGLLDANLVGLPLPTPGAVTIASPSPSRTVYPSRKGTVAFADLTVLPLTTGGSTPNPMTIGRVVGWRNYVSTTVGTDQTFPDLSPSPSPFVTYFLDNGRDFLTVNPSPNPQGRTDQAFATRSELIQLILSSIGTSPNLLQYLSTFSRELNAPTWQSASNPISQRFQLDKISLLGSFPTPAPSPGNAPAIQAAFGLQWSTTTGRWQYVGTQGTTLLAAIPTPAPSGSPRPDFFQVLNYAYPGHTIDQILALGACIIDQYDDDQVTTAIEYAGSPGVAWGMEEKVPPIPMGSPSPSPVPTPISGYVALQRPFQNVGELGYVYNPITGRTLDFHTSGSPDAALLDFFTYNTTDNTSTYHLPYPLRAGTVNINTRNSAIIAALLTGALPNEPAATTAGIPADIATAAASLIASATGAQPAGYNGGVPVGRQDLARLAAAVGTTIGSTEEQEETVVRALSDTTQTRTWGLLIDLIAQTGHFKQGATNLQDGFIVEGEQHYWGHVAIDRFTGQVIDKQVEEVTE
jgi:hypothetical protein